MGLLLNNFLLRCKISSFLLVVQIIDVPLYQNVYLKTNDMAIIQFSTREFRERQASILDLADKGQNVVIRRGNKAYTLTPITEEDLCFTPEVLERIDESLQQVKEGKVHSFDNVEELDRFLDTL